MQTPERVRNIAICGNLHAGKTTFIDCLVGKTHPSLESLSKQNILRYTDTQFLEKKLGVSIKAIPISLVLPDRRNRSHLLNFYDIPGHIDFLDEVGAALRVCDGAILFVDITEGVTVNIEKQIKAIFQEGLSLILCINKIDRLVVELKLPPIDAYLKIRHLLDEINHVISVYCPYDPKIHGENNHKFVSPLLGNVIFASGYYSICFTLEAFANLYSERYQNEKLKLDSVAFAKRLWGNVYFDEKTGRFTKKSPIQHCPITFVKFVLEPIYKVFSLIVGDVDQSLDDICKSLTNITISRQDSRADVRSILKTVFSQFCGCFHSVVDICCDKVYSPLAVPAERLKFLYTGDFSDMNPITSSLTTCDSSGPLVIQIVKLYPTKDGLVFHSFGRVFSGTIKRGQTVQVLGHNYTPEDEEDSRVVTVGRLWILQARHRLQVESVPAGCWVLIEGIDEPIVKTATVVSLANDLNLKYGPQSTKNGNIITNHVFKPIEFVTIPIVKVAVEPMNPSELPKMLDGLRKINKTYPLLKTKVEESGEHVILGSGELYLDCAMHDLRRMYSHTEIRIADPVVTFCETVIETSNFKCFAESPNKKNKITLITEPLDKGMAEEIEKAELIKATSNRSQMIDFFCKKYNWDVLAVRNFWAFGPDMNGPNILLDDTLPTEVDKNKLNAARDHIVQGFQWGTREGPLCEERKK